MIVLTHRTDAPDYHTMNLRGLLPERLAGLAAAEILDTSLLVDGHAMRLGDYWQLELEEDGGGQHLRLIGDCRRCVEVAAEMQSGRLVVAGSVGDYVGRGMRGGSVEVLGDCGRFAAGGLRGGTLHVRGNAGEFAAGAAPGASRGMQGGTLVVDGNCDRWLAARMRRGLVVVRGDVGGGAATRMIAGTLVLSGAMERPVGVGMRRGTLLHLRGEEVAVEEKLSGFTRGELAELSFLPMLMVELERLLPGDQLLRSTLSGKRLTERRAFRSMGDRTVGGLGECLWFPASLVDETDARAGS
jgi:formylmethanofuran dehydrogenase subunit C